MTSSQQIYTRGGTVQAGEGIYIQRQADSELLSLCRDGVYAYLLTARQLGKSSLMVRTAEQLELEGIRTATLDLTQFGVDNITPAQWQSAMLDELTNELELSFDFFEWWNSVSNQAFSQRLFSFLKNVVLEEVPEQIVIFIDEIDSTLNLPFADDFYTVIRSAYNARSRHEAFKRLSVVMIGVATPNELIANPRRTPFNIGQRVELTDFTLDEALPLSKGLKVPADKKRLVMQWILSWTGGHPYLTQRLCIQLAQNPPTLWTNETIKQTVSDTFLGAQSHSDNNLLFVRDMLTVRSSSAGNKTRVLEVYRDIRENKTVRDRTQSPIISHLKLSGVVRSDQGLLHVRNPIYSSVFDQKWIVDNWPEGWFTRIPIQYRVAGIAGFILLLAIASFSLLFSIEARKTVEIQTIAAQQQKVLTDSLSAYADSLSLTNSALQTQNNISEELRKESNDRLLQTMRLNEQLQDSSRSISSLNLQLSQLNKDLSSTNEQLQASLAISDSLNVEVQENLQLAENNLAQARENRLETVTVALSRLALRQQQLGNPELGALLAHQAYLFFEKSRAFKDQIYGALRETLNGLDDTMRPGGPAVLFGHEGWITDIAYSQNGLLLASSGEDGTLILRNTTNLPSEQAYLNHDAGVSSIAFQPDGTMLATGTEDGFVHLWNITSSPPHDRVSWNVGDEVLTLTFSVDGSELITAGTGKEIEFWNLTTQEKISTLIPEPFSKTRALAVSPDNRVLASAHADGRLLIWNLASPASQPAHTIYTQQGSLNSIAFHPRSNYLFSGGDSLTIKAWEVASPYEPQPVVELRGHEGPINSITFDRSGRTMASGSSDNSAHVWQIDVSSNRLKVDTEPIILQEHNAWIFAVALHPSGNVLATGSGDQTLRIWNINPESLHRELCNRLNVELTQPDWNNFVGSDLEYDEHYESCRFSFNAIR